MNDFLEKWKNDKKYRTKIKLLAYTAFVVVVSIYALSLNGKTPQIDNSDYNLSDSKTTSNSIDIPENYTYSITINIDDEIYTYSGQKTNNEETIKKTHNGTETNYKYSNNEYYILTDDIYQLTSKELVYDNINYNYINLANINKYLIKDQKINNEYNVYLKDVILSNETNNYFTITINGNYINIDYTPLINEFDPQIKKYFVEIIIEKK